MAQAQVACMLTPVPLDKRVQLASLIIEAQLISQHTELGNHHLYTLNELEVYKVFRGELPPGKVVLSTTGGILGIRREEVSTTPLLTSGMQGVFLLTPSLEHPNTYELIAGPQGFIVYDTAAGSATEPFSSYKSIEREVYPALQARTGTKWRVVRPNAALTNQRARAARPTAAPVITSFSPATTTAGTGSVLTIQGSGFGSARGTGAVGFRNANVGGASYMNPLPTEYISWSDTEIRVRVSSAGAPGVAGTGSIQVRNNNGETGTSTTNLTIDYAIGNLTYNNDPYQAALVGTNPQGGYTLQYTNRFAASPAHLAFQRAQVLWQNGVGANWAAGPATAVNMPADDQVNIVGFDDAQELPAGVLGTAYTYYQGCFDGTGNLHWVLSGTDYIFDEEQVWNFASAAPGSSQNDFESVALHELGHGLLLGHIIQPGAVMHFQLQTGTTARTLSPKNDLAGATAEINYSLSAVSCSFTAYTLAPAISLPVTLTHFSATPTWDGAQLRWRTATEVNSKAFIIESTAAPHLSAGWQEVTRISAQGNSLEPHIYTWHDPQALTRQRYYRLRLLDLDDTWQYSTVAVCEPLPPPITLQAYPNPASRHVQVNIPPATDGVLRLYDLTGRLMRTLKVPDNQSTLDLELIEQPGLYLLEWTSSGQSKHIRLLKQ
ncbi:T9SS type A sorting domain-containing protein [Hymenobacter sp. BT730]|uniref:T9SS type A sorting domain-containing protein n=1 Tax=Hymenobacter sp. BT730 TaxID=3063332 RepID=UPI0026E0043E|nr:T9SS type A sorting domain-containing protein [Hymenobacter sp. BT730]